MVWYMNATTSGYIVGHLIKYLLSNTANYSVSEQSTLK
jgi:hypothetical protein